MRKRFAHNRAITLSLFFASDKFDETSFFVCVLFYFVVGVCVCVCVCSLKIRIQLRRRR